MREVLLMNNLLTKLKLRKLYGALVQLQCCNNSRFFSTKMISPPPTSATSSSTYSSTSFLRCLKYNAFRCNKNVFYRHVRHFRSGLVNSESNSDNSINSRSSSNRISSSPHPGPTLAPPPSSWIDSSMIPNAIRPYLHLARADKQAGTLLLLWPCIWGVSLAAPMGCLPDPWLIAKFAIGSLVMRGAGCTINDIFDRDFDKHVERTKTRPLASGALTVTNAVVFLAAQLSVGLGILLSFDDYTIMLGMASMPLVVVYPLMKRVTYFPQLVLGLAFNWGALVGWSAVNGDLLLGLGWTHAVPLYLSGVFWTLVYDTVYGYQDRSDDKKLGLKSTSLYLGDKPQIPLTVLALLSSTSLAIAGYTTDLSTPFYVGTGIAASHLLWQVWSMKVNETANLWARFNSNKYLGGLVAASIIAGHF